MLYIYISSESPPPHTRRSRPLNDADLRRESLLHDARLRPVDHGFFALALALDVFFLARLVFCHFSFDFHFLVDFVFGGAAFARGVAFFFDAVEDAAELGEPVWVDGGDGGHVFFGREDEFVVDCVCVYISVSVLGSQGGE